MPGTMFAGSNVTWNKIMFIEIGASTTNAKGINLLSSSKNPTITSIIPTVFNT